MQRFFHNDHFKLNLATAFACTLALACSSVIAAQDNPLDQPDRRTPDIATPDSDELVGSYEEAEQLFHAGNYEAAYRMMRPLAEDGDPGAQFYTARMLEMGQGTQQNESEAITWYLRAALTDSYSAIVNLGVMHANGRGTQKNETLAAEFFRLAALHGQANGMASYFDHLYFAMGIPKDAVEALAWCELAADAGNEVCQNNLTIIRQELTPAEVDRATQRASALRTIINDKAFDQTLPAEAFPADFERGPSFESSTGQQKFYESRETPGFIVCFEWEFHPSGRKTGKLMMNNTLYLFEGSADVHGNFHGSFAVNDERYPITITHNTNDHSIQLDSGNASYQLHRTDSPSQRFPELEFDMGDFTEEIDEMFEEIRIDD